VGRCPAPSCAKGAYGEPNMQVYVRCEMPPKFDSSYVYGSKVNAAARRPARRTAPGVKNLWE